MPVPVSLSSRWGRATGRGRTSSGRSEVPEVVRPRTDVSAGFSLFPVSLTQSVVVFVKVKTGKRRSDDCTSAHPDTPTTNYLVPTKGDT